MENMLKDKKSVAETVLPS